MWARLLLMSQVSQLHDNPFLYISGHSNEFATDANYRTSTFLYYSFMMSTSLARITCNNHHKKVELASSIVFMS